MGAQLCPRGAHDARKARLFRLEQAVLQQFQRAQKAIERGAHLVADHAEKARARLERLQLALARGGGLGLGGESAPVEPPELHQGRHERQQHGEAERGQRDDLRGERRAFGVGAARVDDDGPKAERAHGGAHAGGQGGKPGALVEDARIGAVDHRHHLAQDVDDPAYIRPGRIGPEHIPVGSAGAQRHGAAVEQVELAARGPRCLGICGVEPFESELKAHLVHLELREHPWQVVALGSAIFLQFAQHLHGDRRRRDHAGKRKSREQRQRQSVASGQKMIIRAVHRGQPQGGAR